VSSAAQQSSAVAIGSGGVLPGGNGGTPLALPAVVGEQELRSLLATITNGEATGIIPLVEWLDGDGGIYAQAPAGLIAPGSTERVMWGAGFFAQQFVLGAFTASVAPLPRGVTWDSTSSVRVRLEGGTALSTLTNVRWRVRPPE